MEHVKTDVAIIGAGIAGAGVAAALGPGPDITLIEREARPGYHSTGRSAAIFIQNYGNAVIRALSRASAPLFTNADPEFHPTPLLKKRGILFVTDESGLAEHNALVGAADGLEPIEPEAATEMVPLLKREWARAAAFEPNAMDIDVAALHQGWLRKARMAGVKLLTDAPVMAASRSDGKWLIETPGTRIEARAVIDAAGAWADEIAAIFGVRPVGLTPMRRSMAVLPAPAGFTIGKWPLVSETADRWYFKPDAGRLLVSPAEEDPVTPQDAAVDDMVLAEGLDRYEHAVTAPVTRVERSWAGLRTFAPDRSPVVGFDPEAEGFFWLAGQGGYGIQTSPALSALAADLFLRRSPDPQLGKVVEALSPARFRPRGA
jgi:D-arginine dehydrogenase